MLTHKCFTSYVYPNEKISILILTDGPIHFYFKCPTNSSTPDFDFYAVDVAADIVNNNFSSVIDRR